MHSEITFQRVKKITIGSKGIPFVNTNDGRTIRYPDPNIKAKDTIVVTTTTNKITDFIKSETGNLSIVLRGLNAGRIGLIVQQETHLGSHTTVTLGDALGNNFSTRKKNVFVIGKGNKPMVSLPKDKGIRFSILQKSNDHGSVSKSKQNSDCKNI
jgi:small subunit ribosomal protein S4e